MQHITYILGLNIKDNEKLELIKCYLESKEYSLTYTNPTWTGGSPYTGNGNIAPLNGIVTSC